MKSYFHQTPYEINDSDTIAYCEKSTLKQEIDKTIFALENAYSGFNNVTDPELIDCYIYQINSIMKRYSYLLRLANQT